MKKSVWLIATLLLVGLLGTACVAVDAPVGDSEMSSGDGAEEMTEEMADVGDYPERPVQFVVPWPPGDLEDVLTRLIAEEMQSQTGVPAAVVNKPGGGGVVGATEVFQADADGHTIGSFVIGIPTVQIQNGNAPYERGDFEPLGIFVTYPFVIAAASDAPYSNMEELVAYSKENDVTLGHFGFGLVPTRATILSMEDLGGSFTSEAAFDVLDCATISAGDVDVINTTIQLLLPCLDEVTILASIGSDRLAVSPDTPTLGEQGGIDIMLWNGLFVKKDTPQPIRDMISEFAQTALASEAANDVAASTGAQIYWMDAEASQAQVDADWDMIADMVERMGQ
ncbi:MAG: tripartite tricarboxylate transporter substrate binding protein [Chloroflexota bacterium]